MQIRLENLKRTYDTQNGVLHAVNGVTLDIPSNTVYGIIGRSGAGKSTLVRLISLLEKTDEGAVYYDGTRVDNLHKDGLIERRRRLGMIFQNFNLFSSRTAAENIAYPLEICRVPKAQIQERVSELLEMVGLADRGNAPISTLSGGQKQRIAIARSLANKPDILFCDEATSALDPQTTRSILQLIREIQRKMNLTVVMITHQMEVVRDACDRVAVLENGCVVEHGNVADIFAHPASTVTKDFLAHISIHEQEQGVSTEVQNGTVDLLLDVGENPKNFVRWSKEGGKYILRFVGALTGEPVLSRLSRNFNIEFNIRAGGVQHLCEKDVGTMITDITGESSEIAKAVEFLRSQGVIVESAVEGVSV